MIKGSQWWEEQVPEGLGDGYTRAILEAVERGDAVIEWTTILEGDLEFEIMTAPLAIGTFDDHVFLFGLSAEAVDLIALALEARGLPVMSPTPYLYDLAAQDPRQRQIGPHTLPELIGQQNGAAGMTKAAAKAHSDAVLRSRPESCSFISACCKVPVLDPRFRANYACEYGWRLPGKVGWGSRNESGTGYVVQEAQWAHFYRYFFDYAGGAVYVRAACRMFGRTEDLREMARGGHGRHLVAPLGVVAYIRHPDCREDFLDTTESVPDTIPAPSSRPTLLLGSRGAAVGDWQRILMRAGYSLAPYNDDDSFGTLTHNATVGFQKERGIPGCGVVGPSTWAAEYAEPIKRPAPDGMITDTIPAKNFTWANRTIVDNIVIHTIEAAEASTTGDNTAYWFNGKYTKAPRASAHVCFDDDSTIQCVPSHHIAWAAPGLNKKGLQYEHAGFARQTLAEWQDPFSRRMLERSARKAAADCAQWNIPIRYVDAAGLLRGERGITTHYQVTLGPGKGKTTHTDPGRGFPMSAYLDMIKRFSA